MRATILAGYRRLWLEFVAVFGLVPVAIAVLMPPERMFTALFALTVVGLVLLHTTPNFSWRDLAAGLGRISWRFVAIFATATVLVGTAVMLTARPDGFLILVRTQPGLMLLILLLYPVLSAFPQEILFRPLFFRRYAPLLPENTHAKIALNAVLFAHAHLMYWSWVVTLMTLAGGAVFAYSYEVRRNFPEALVLHSVSGGIIFALGLGYYFYSGNVQRPF